MQNINISLTFPPELTHLIVLSQTLFGLRKLVARGGLWQQIVVRGRHDGQLASSSCTSLLSSTFGGDEEKILSVGDLAVVTGLKRGLMMALCDNGDEDALFIWAVMRGGRRGSAWRLGQPAAAWPDPAKPVRSSQIWNTAVDENGNCAMLRTRSIEAPDPETLQRRPCAASIKARLHKCPEAQTTL